MEEPETTDYWVMLTVEIERIPWTYTGTYVLSSNLSEANLFYEVLAEVNEWRTRYEDLPELPPNAPILFYRVVPN